MIPDVIPTRIPALLAMVLPVLRWDGNEYSSHNLNEVLDSCLAYIDNENITIDELMQYILAQTSQQRH